MELVFLEASADRKLAKTFTPTGSISYPMVKTFARSYHEDVSLDTDALDTIATLLRRHAGRGHALHKGPLREPIVNASRKGLGDKEALTSLLIIDIDKVELPNGMTLPESDITANDLRQTANALVHQLPKAFHDVSFIAQASASFGMDLRRGSLHIAFVLQHPVSPRALKLLLQHLNFTPYYEDKLELSGAGLSLHYPIDITVADNNRLIYIAPPTFQNVANPFVSDEERIVVIRKTSHALDVRGMIDDINPEQVHKVATQKLKTLRTAAGLGSKTAKTQRIRINERSFDVITNPDQVMLEKVRDEGRYIRYNLNGGDSQAYYVDKYNPTIVYNFKGEPPFLLEAADPDTFEKHMNEYKEDLGRDDMGRRPFTFRDIYTDTHYSGFLTPDGKHIDEMHKTSLVNLKHFFAFHGHAMPDIVPQLYYEFRPDDDREIDWKDQFVNKYTKPPLVSDPPTIPEQYQKLGFGTATMLKDLCPTVYKIIHSVVGSSDESFETFINWLAMLYQTRNKIGTAWIFSGVEGTGKGVMFNDILRPIFGTHYCSEKKLANLVDNFNSWVENKLLVMVDEFKVDNKKTTQDTIENTLKHLITETHTTVRAMRTDQFDIKSYCNFIFASNHDDVTPIPESDRRFNVAPRQEVMLIKRHPEMLEAINSQLPDEVPLFAAILSHFHVDTKEAVTARENEAKQLMREASRNTVDAWCMAIKNGNMDYFLPYLNEEPLSYLEMEAVPSFERVMKRLIAQGGVADILSYSDLRVMYKRVLGQQITSEKLSRMLKMRGMNTVRKTDPALGTRVRGVQVTFVTKDYDYDELLGLLTDSEKESLGIQLSE